MKRVKKAMEGNGGLHMDISKPGGYTLVWHDEFDGSVLDPARWQLLESMRGSEDTGLADESNPAVMRVEDSQLKLSAIRDKNVDDGGPALYDLLFDHHVRSDAFSIWFSRNAGKGALQERCLAVVLDEVRHRQACAEGHHGIHGGSGCV